MIEEELPRRYWISVQLAENAEPNQKAFMRFLGFEEIGPHTFLKKTRDLDLLTSLVKQMSKNSFCFLATTQPLCKNCGSLQSFRSQECFICGSRDIEPRGQVVYNEQYEPTVIFKRSPRPTPATT